MQCPVCVSAVLVMTDRQGVEIDYCPNCRGVWLDRGELDKILERNAAVQPRAEGAFAPPPGRGDSYRRDDDDDWDDDDRRDHSKGPRKKKRRSLLDDLFDF